MCKIAIRQENVLEKYFIYKNFLSLDSIIKAEEYKQDIIVNHRNSKYAEILLDPTTVSKEKQNSNQIYERLYLDFNEQKYIQVIDESNKYILDFNGEPIVPKLEFLKALAIAICASSFPSPKIPNLAFPVRTPISRRRRFLHHPTSSKSSTP